MVGGLIMTHDEELKALHDECDRLIALMDGNSFRKIEQWAEDRNLIRGATPHAQMLKLTEEVGELAAGIARGQMPKIEDSIGDCVVVLTILAKQYCLNIEDCIAYAYDEIKDRKGKLVDGVFIKEEV
jgi:NTP pyrophosphatase (non-canonical NTP hydrolase)